METIVQAWKVEEVEQYVEIQMGGELECSWLTRAVGWH